MKILKLLLVTIILLSCNKSHIERDVISIFDDTGNNRGVLLISDRLGKIDSAYQRGGPQKSKIEYFGVYERFVVSTEALKHLMKYVDSHCQTLNEEKTKMMAAFIVTSYSLNDKQDCFLYYRSKNIEYFTKMIDWIDNSKYKSEYKEFLVWLHLYVEVIKKGKRETMYD